MMRILLVCHAQTDGALPDHILRLGNELRQRDCEVRALVCGNRPIESRDFPVDVFPGDPPLSFPVPCLGGDGARVGFADLSADQIAEYRSKLRDRMIALTDAFDPSVIHCCELWLTGTLALETGVPYLTQVHGDDLTLYETLEHYRQWVDQAAENASRVIVATEFQHTLIKRLFGLDTGRVLRCAGLAETVNCSEFEASVATMLELYSGLLRQRY